MEYQEARRIRGKSLLSLIAERKFEEGQGIGASIGGAISDRFKARATGIKEALDPLNWVRKLTGEGAVGDIAVSGLGRLFGRSDEAITAFGGYGRNKKSKTKKKDPRFTTVNAGPIKPTRVGDSVADILGKMYNFMMKSNEIYRRNDEIEQAFRQEQLDEDNRRHKELVNAIKSYMKAKKGEGGDDKDKDNRSFFDKLKSGLDDIIESIAAWKLGKTLVKGGAKAGGKVLEKIGAKAVGKKLAEKVGTKVGGRVGAKIITKMGTGMMTSSQVLGKTLTKKETAKLAEKGIRFSPKSGQFHGTGRRGAIGAEEVNKLLGRKTANKATKKISRELLNKSIKSVIKKRGLSSVIKKIPVLGLAAGLFFAMDRLMAKDWVGAGGELASGLMGGSGVGIAGSVATDLGLAARDVYMESYDGAKPEEDMQKDPELVKERFKEIIEELKKEIPPIPSPITNIAGKGRGYTGPQPAPVTKQVPAQTSMNQQGGGSAQVSVNNNVNNVAGKAPKVVNVNPTPVRNREVDRYVRSQAVPV